MIYSILLAVSCIVILILLSLIGLWVYGLGLPLTKEERAKNLPGDELILTKEKLRLELAITINAPKEKVYAYIVQLGLRKAGFYSFSWLERFFGFHIYNTYSIVDEWQTIHPGDFMFYHQCGIGSEIKAIKENNYLTSLSDSRLAAKDKDAIAFVPPIGLKSFAWTWNFILLEAGEGRTRFITRCDCSFTPFTWLRKFLIVLILGTPSFVMNRRMLVIIKKCAEGKKQQLSLIDRLLKKICQ